MKQWPKLLSASSQTHLTIKIVEEEEEEEKETIFLWHRHTHTKATFTGVRQMGRSIVDSIKPLI